MSADEETIAALYARIGEGIIGLALGEAGRLAPIFLLTTVVLVFALWLLRRPGSGFLRWAFPREVWFHPSHWVDVKVFLLGRFLTFLSASLTVLMSSSLGAQISAAIGEGTGGSGDAVSDWHPLIVAILILLVADFCVYWFHRLSHEWPVLWPFHATHHSAEVMTPITVYRKHPVYDLMSGLFGGAVMGLVMGVVLGITVGAVPVAMIGGVNILYYLFNVAGANLRHSHVWLSYGRIVEHIVISPAQHQVHHSIDPRHHDRNYGEVLAIWDWMFGTLYVPEGPEELRFGLSDAKGNPLPQPHPTLGRFLIEPFRSSWAAALRLVRRIGSRP
jgi:sterol desaturase/sphingolipid hydroxylase (fatty acid hydroxylase superfamily)